MTERRPHLVQVQIADVVVAKIAALHAVGVPGVVALRPSLSQAAIHHAGRMIRAPRRRPTSADEPPPISTDGVDARIDDDHSTTVTVDVVVRFGHPCLEVAVAVQQRVASHIEADTGLAATVAVNIVDIDLSDPAQPVGPSAPTA